MDTNRLKRILNLTEHKERRKPLFGERKEKAKPEPGGGL